MVMKKSSVLLKILVIVVAVCMLFACASCSKKDKTPDDSSISLSNKNATPETIALYNYITSTYTHSIISGQQESTWISEDYEFDYIYEHTGKYPAIRGLDFINDDFDGVVERAKKWAARGGIVTICWHCSSALDGGYDDSKVPMSQADWDKILTDGTPEHTAFITAMDKAGRALKLLQDEGIPVIWRPYHECDGWWFWWSQQNGEYFKRLWIMSYEHFTNDLHLNNLIWMLGFSHAEGIMEGRMADFFPGSEYCDIVGADSYNVANNGAEETLFNACHALVEDSKPIAFHETGLIPTVDEFKETKWAYFMTWHTEYLVDRNSVEALNTLYNDPYVITLSDLPDFYS